MRKEKEYSILQHGEDKNGFSVVDVKLCVNGMHKSKYVRSKLSIYIHENSGGYPLYIEGKDCFNTEIVFRGLWELRGFLSAMKEIIKDVDFDDVFGGIEP